MFKQTIEIWMCSVGILAKSNHLLCFLIYPSLYNIILLSRSLRENLSGYPVLWAADALSLLLSFFAPQPVEKQNAELRFLCVFDNDPSVSLRGLLNYIFVLMGLLWSTKFKPHTIHRYWTPRTAGSKMNTEWSTFALRRNKNFLVASVCHGWLTILLKQTHCVSEVWTSFLTI